MGCNLLLDVNIVLDVIFKRSLPSIALFEKTVEKNSKLFLVSSMMPTIDFYLQKYKVNKTSFSERFFSRFSIISALGKDVRLSMAFKDPEDALIALSFKRVCPDGIIISSDKGFPDDIIKIVTPDGMLKILEGEPPEIKIPMLDLKEEYRYAMEEIDSAILNSVAQTNYILGPEVKELETRIAEYLGVKHCIGCSSGTEALVLSLRALAIKIKGQEYFDRSDLIITTPFTFTATGDAILRAGATPVFVDIDPETYNIDPVKIREYLTQNLELRTKNSTRVVGLLPVHLYGQSCRMDEIMAIAEEHNLFVVEDIAQAFGGTWNGSTGSPQKLGSIGSTGCFSFFPSKNLGGFGDGGMVSTSDDQLNDLMRMLLKHGGKDKYNVDHIGYNARLDTLQAAVLLAKFKYIDEFNSRRRKIAEMYNTGLAGVDGLILPVVPSSKPSALSSLPSADGHVFHQYTVRVLNGKREAMQKHLKEHGVSTMVYYPFPLHKMKVFADGRSKTSGILEHAEKAAMEVLSLPTEPLMKAEDSAYVIDVVKRVFA